MRIRNDSQLFLLYNETLYQHSFFSIILLYNETLYQIFILDLVYTHSFNTELSPEYLGGKKLDTSFMSLTHFETASNYLKSIPGASQ